MRIKTPFYENFAARVRQLGGLHNAHMHLDRAGTLDDRYMAQSSLKILENSVVSLKKKHSLIQNLHIGPAFDTDDLVSRAEFFLDVMIEAGTTRIDSTVDVTLDRVGLSALETLSAIRDRRKSEIDLRLGAYTPFGFKDSEPQRWELLQKGAELADFIGCLPEADDLDDYPGHIGFEEHCERHLDLASRLGKMLHVHTDQRNQASEAGTERLIEVARRVGAPSGPDREPLVWAVHMISPSTYSDERHRRLIEGLIKCNIGVICCPSAAIGMRQLRPLETPTYNSIPRILELIEAGVHVRLGTDNVADICSPTTTADLTDEVFMLSAAIRFYNPGILAKLAAGVLMDDAERALVREHLRKNDEEIAKVVASETDGACGRMISSADLDRVSE